MTRLTEDDPVQQITEIQIKIEEKKIKGKTDSLFYGEIAHGYTSDGSHFWVKTEGEIRLIYKGEEYTGGSLGGKLPFDELNDKRIDRTTKFGNGFHIGSDGNRAVVIKMYEEHLKLRPRFIPIIKKELKGYNLVCHCAPKPGHGDILLQIANDET